MHTLICTPVHSFNTCTPVIEEVLLYWEILETVVTKTLSKLNRTRDTSFYWAYFFTLFRPVNGAEVLEAGLLGEDEDDGVVAVAAAGVHRDGGGLVHNHQVLRHRDQADAGRGHRNLVPAMAGYRDIYFILSPAEVLFPI